MCTYNFADLSAPASEKAFVKSSNKQLSRIYPAVDISPRYYTQLTGSMEASISMDVAAICCGYSLNLQLVPTPLHRQQGGLELY